MIKQILETETMNKQHFRIIYDGQALQEHTMDVRDLAPALLAMGNVFEEANYVLNGDRAKVSVQVKASFQTGCFGIDLDVVQSLANQIKDLFANQHVAKAKEILDLLGISSFDAVIGTGGAAYASLIVFMKWLKGRKPTGVELLNNGLVKVICDNECLEIEQRILDMYRCYKLRQALEAAIVKPLDKPGIESFAVETSNGKFIEIQKAYSNWFKAPEPESEDMGTIEYDTNLQLVSISFREDNKWRFSEGGNTFYAAINDDRFLDSINKNEESFSKGDILRVTINKRQWLANEELRTEYIIKEIKEHRNASVQMKLPFIIPDKD